MPVVNYPTEFAGAAESPHQPDPWLALWEIYLDNPEPPTAPRVTRIVGSRDEVEWPPGSGIKYKPVSLTYGDIEETGEGVLPAIDIAISNVTRYLMRDLELYDLEGNPAKMTVINKGFETIPTAALEFEFEVAQASADREAVRLRLEVANPFERIFPAEKYSSSRCGWVQFGGAGCGYVINSAAGFTVCPRTVDACDARGDDEVSRGLPRNHPRRFRGAPGIPVQRLR